MIYFKNSGHIATVGFQVKAYPPWEFETMFGKRVRSKAVAD